MAPMLTVQGSGQHSKSGSENPGSTLSNAGMHLAVRSWQALTAAQGDPSCRGLCKAPSNFRHWPWV